MSLISARNKLYLKISEGLTTEEVRSLRSLVTIDGHLPRGRVEHASPQDIFIMLERKLIISEGNLGFLAELLRQLHHSRLAEEVMAVEKAERGEGDAVPEPETSRTKCEITQPTRAPPMFISYCSDPYTDKKRTKGEIEEDVKMQRERVKTLSDELRRNGIDSRIDQYENYNPPTFWTKWTEEQIKSSDYVLMVCTPNYLKCIRGRRNEDAETESGASFQGIVFYSQLADPKLHGKFLPVFFDDVDRSLVPTCLRGAHVYGPLGDRPKYGQEKFDQLFCKIVGRIPKNKVPPPLGNVPAKFKSRKKES
uniref:SEFIR domain-containing protein n=1 Tax=Branchiostoma floridae TaxID=7739 RepID=C3ZXR4_BRAFL|eukprot:XP_002586655.1 hypothetical protein BRAFLDRAFT_105685 [Branchiostoma floridae]